MRVPRILHYCFGMARDFGGRPWGLSHYVCLRSAIEHIRPDRVCFYYQYEPSGPWWDLTRPLVDAVEIAAPTEVFGNPLSHPAHRADVVRLEKLIESGGIYLDADIVVHRSFDPLLDHKVVLGAEGKGRAFGTANAVIIAEPAARFLVRWYEEYRSFRGRDREYWSEHSVQLPLFLARQMPDEVAIVDYRAFFWPLWTKLHLEWIFNSTRPCVFPETYATHLWEGKSYRYTQGLTPGEVRAIDTNFHRWARPYLKGLPDDFGAPAAKPDWSSRPPTRSELARDILYVAAIRARSKVKPRRYQL